MRFAQEDAYARRNWLLDRVASLQPEQNFEVAAELAPSKPRGNESLEAARAHLKQDLDFLLLYYRDLLMRKLGADSVHLFNRDRVESVTSHADRLTERNISDILDSILTTGDYVDMNANISLALENMVFRLGSCQAQPSAAE
jgi:hypothetical protein